MIHGVRVGNLLASLASVVLFGCTAPPSGPALGSASKDEDQRSRGMTAGRTDSERTAGPFATTTGALSVCPSGPTIYGVDVSQYQTAIDWAKVAKTNVKFAITRIGHGVKHDTYFETNWAAIKANGLVRGAYLFYAPTQDAAEQAQHVIDSVGMLEAGDLPVTIDVEWTTGTPVASHLATVVDMVHQGTGKRPMIYTATGYWNQYFSTEFGELDLWVANWGAACPSIPSSWKGWVFWQTSGGGGTVSGIPGGVDENLFNGTLEQLQAVAGLGPKTGCSLNEALGCGAFGCGCADATCSGGACAGTGCSGQATLDCGAFGCGCVDGACSGGACAGSGCTFKESNDCATAGCYCDLHACICETCSDGEKAACLSAGCGGCENHACVECPPPPTCTADEIEGCQSSGCGGCADHACTDCPVVSGCDASEETICASLGCGCQQHVCSGGLCATPSCSAEQVSACAGQGCGCADGLCSGGVCSGTGCGAKVLAACKALGKSCWLGDCIETPTDDTGTVAEPAQNPDVVEPVDTISQDDVDSSADVEFPLDATDELDGIEAPSDDIGGPETPDGPEADATGSPDAGSMDPRLDASTGPAADDAANGVDVAGVPSDVPSIDTSSGDEPPDAVASKDAARSPSGGCTTGAGSTPAAGAAATLGLLILVLRRSARARKSGASL